MPRVSRRLVIPAAAADVWDVVADPHHLPRWWPRTRRVEDVRGGGQLRGTQWTLVFETRGGRGVRADYRCLAATSRERFAFEQLIEGTPFEGILRGAEFEVLLRPADAGTEVTLTADQRLRGLSRFGGPMMRRATGRTLAEALAGLKGALGGEAAR